MMGAEASETVLAAREPVLACPVPSLEVFEVLHSASCLRSPVPVPELAPEHEPALVLGPAPVAVLAFSASFAVALVAAYRLDS